MIKLILKLKLRISCPWFLWNQVSSYYKG